MASDMTKMSAVKLALLARQVRQEIPDAAVLQSEPIAIVGLSCRFPGGADSPERYWRLLKDGVDAITEVPAVRWDAHAMYDRDPAAPGKMSTRWGAFLPDVDQFDPTFFGIAPREAANMDPQQRVLLETAFEALDDAGLVQEALAGSPTGVFVAVYNDDYAMWRMSDLSKIDAYTGLGTAHCVACGRLSFLLDLQGPSLAVDTGCSSSLVAVHLACQSLRAGECRTALAGGVNLVLSPEVTVSLSKWGFMASDGRCKTFDASADGFVRGEGCGVIVLKRLADALVDGDRVLAVIRGTAVNEDGRSTVLTAPSGPAQQAVVRQALANGRLAADEITYVEAHGTGTALGDPIEVEALAEVVGRPADGEPCLIGSVKTNFGHLEAAAGMAGLIKTVLALQHEHIPPSLHFRSLNPHISLEGTRLAIAAEGRAWPRSARRRLAGVSSFGFGGTNAHIVLEEAPVVPTPVREAASYALPISARNVESLQALASKYAERLAEDGDAALWDICYTAAVRRTHHEYRAVAIGASRAELADAMASVARGETRWDASTGRRLAGSRSGPVFVFCGQGPQWWGMGRQLMASDAVYRRTLDDVAAIMDPITGWSLIAELERDEAGTRLGETAIAQPAIFALQVALVSSLASRGVKPAAVVGHSVGEIAAAYLAGALTLAQAARLVVHRGRVMQKATGLGRMVSVSLAPEAGERVIAAHAGRLSVAAINGPQSIVLAGDPESIASTVKELERAGTSHRMLPVNYAFHSSQMQALVPELRPLIGAETMAAATLPWISTVTGALADARTLTGDYWVRNVTQPVRFSAAIRSCEQAGYDTFVEIGPHPVLGGSIAESLQQDGSKIVPVLHRGRPDGATVMAAIGRLHAGGESIDWKRVYPAGHPVTLPAYPWQRQRYWMPRPEPAPSTSARTTVTTSLAGTRLRSPLFTDVVFERDMTATSPAFVADHRIHGSVVFPATGYIAMVFAAATEAFGRVPAGIDGLALDEPLVLDDQPRRVQIILSGPGDDVSFRIVSLDASGAERWAVHATGRIAPGARAESSTVDAKIGEWAVEVTAEEHYRRLAARGCDFGPAFRRLHKVASQGARAVGEVDAGEGSGGLDPGVLDSCLQALNALMPDDGTYLPVGIDAVRVFGKTRGVLRAVATLDDAPLQGDSRSARIVVVDHAGRAVVDIQGFRLRRVTAAAVLRAFRRVPDGWLHRVDWEVASADTTATGPRGRWIILGDGAGLAARLATAMSTSGHDAIVLAADGELAAPAATDPLAGIVDLVPLDFGLRAADSVKDVEQQTAQSCGHALQLVQRLVAERVSTRLWVVTRGAQQTGYEAAAADPVQSAVWSFGRVVDLEHPELACTRIDLDPATGADAADQLSRELMASASEPEVALRAGTRLVPRLDRLATPARPQTEPVVLEIATRGALDNMRYVPAVRQQPGAGEVEIQVRATGLNFRDVLNVLGMYPGQAGAPGDEVSGTVTAVGPGVDDLEVGDDVVGLARASFATYAIGSVARLVKKPASLSFSEAATIPSAFLTAHYALDRIARLRPGDRVLIHAGAGGVGLAALQLAMRTGAEVFATAGSDDKRDYLRSLGVRHVMSSRTLDFADDIRAATNGRGVDVVLNSLGGEFIPKSLSVLAPGGRFVEIGRTGIWSSPEAAAVRADVDYTVLFLVDEFERNPAEVRAALVTLVDRAADGDLRSLPARVFPLSSTVDAFRFMAGARHIGKVVVVQEAPVRPRSSAFDDGASYLVTGGFGALGLQAAQHMVDAGVRNLVLVGRRAPSDGAARTIAHMEAGGARVRQVQADIAGPDAAELIRQALQGLPALRGVVHAAGVLDDGLLTDLTPDRLRRVLAPKVAGTWNLHELTSRMPLDFFVMFSGGASLLGSRGQGNYAAANGFLDAMASYRQRHGLPGLAISWGAWADSGMAASLPARERERYAAQGVSMIPGEQGLQVFEHLAHAASAPLVGVFPIDWARFVRDTGAKRPFLTRLAVEREPVRHAPSAESRSLPDLLAAVSPAEQPKILLAFVRESVLRVLGLSPAYELDVNQGLRDLGLDSLMAVELRNVLQASAGKPLSATLAFDYPTVAALTKHLRQVLGLDGLQTPAGAGAPAAAAPDFASDIDALSEEDAEAQLAAELAALEMDTHGN